MREIILFSVCAAVAIAVWHVHRAAAQTVPKPIRYQDVNGWVELDRPPDQTVYFRRQNVTGLAIYSKTELGIPGLVITIGAKQFRIDCSTRDEADALGRYIRKGNKDGT